jgi:hypothetical protein
MRAGAVMIERSSVCTYWAKALAFRCAWGAGQGPVAGRSVKTVD